MFACLVAWAALMPSMTHAQGQGAAAPQRCVVVDQTGLTLPGVRIEVRRDNQIIETATTDADGAFELNPGAPQDVVHAVLDGFEPVQVPRAEAARITLLLARTTEVTEVVASALASSGASMERLGSTMPAPLAQRLPAARPRILQSLPLLPAVVRGRDGLLRIGGTRPHESSLWVDGFDVTDPVSGTTLIDLPNESVKGMAVVRDPVSATFNNVVGSMASIETTAGTGDFRFGVQGFIPRPQLNRQYGLGRIEAFFPRAYVGGRAGIARYFSSIEGNFERIPIPGVTSQSGSPASGTTGLVSFTRVDFDLSPRNTLTVEGMVAPSTQNYSGLSPLQRRSAAPDIHVLDVFGGVIERITVAPSQLITLRLGVLSHTNEISVPGSGAAVLRPDGWRDNWFSQNAATGRRVSASATWDRAGLPWFGTHTVSLSSEFKKRTMDATMAHVPIDVQDDAGRRTRLVQFAATPGVLTVDDFGAGGGVRDVWDVSRRLQVDLNLRIDWDQKASGLTPSPRAALRYALDDNQRTVIKASAGRFVGLVSLGALAFPQFPNRTDQRFNPASGALISASTFQTASETLDLPRADGVSIEVEQELRPGLDLQAGFRARRGSRMPTVAIPANGGTTTLQSTGASLYQEFSVSVRQAWTADAMLFASYVHARSRSDLNDFGSLFVNIDAPFLEPGGTVTTAADVPDRLRAWATVQLPEQIVVSPSVDWRTGFPYSTYDEYRRYVGEPNSRRFPTYFAVDLTVFKTLEVFDRKLDLGVQFFNLTGHDNPRDVISVVSSPRFGELTNNPGRTLGGYMQIRW